MISTPFEQIDEAAILNLVANEIGEGRMLEYKETLPANSDSEKIEFLADVSSFANTAGGHILYGIREKRNRDGKPTGIPESADGLRVNVDSEILRLEAIIRSSLAPRVPGFRSKAVHGFSKGPVLVLWIPKSWSGPHMVTYKNHSRFYSRSSNGKYALDVSEIRSAFLLSEGLPDKIRKFRDERLARIIAGDTPVPLLAGPKLVFHQVPIGSLAPNLQLDISEIYSKRQTLESIGLGSTSHRVNFDGVVTFCFDSDPVNCDSYVQAFRNGIIEAVETAEFGEGNGKKFIRSLALENDLIHAASRFLEFQQSFGVPPPIFLMITLVGVKDMTLATKSDYRSVRVYPIDRDVLLLPEIVVEQFDQDIPSVLRPAFDALWQAAGFLRSAHYSQDGIWTPPA